MYVGSWTPTRFKHVFLGKFPEREGDSVVVSVRPILLGHSQANDVAVSNSDDVSLAYEHSVEPCPVGARVLYRRLGFAVLRPGVVPVDCEMLRTHPEIGVFYADLAFMGSTERDTILFDVFVDTNPPCCCGNSSPRFVHSFFLSLLFFLLLLVLEKKKKKTLLFYMWKKWSK